MINIFRGFFVFPYVFPVFPYIAWVMHMKVKVGPWLHCCPNCLALSLHFADRWITRAYLLVWSSSSIQYGLQVIQTQSWITSHTRNLYLGGAQHLRMVWLHVALIVPMNCSQDYGMSMESWSIQSLPINRPRDKGWLEWRDEEKNNTIELSLDRHQ